MKNYCRIVAVALVLLFGCPSGAAVAQISAETAGSYDHFFGYVQACISGDLDRAMSYWHPADIANAARLGIRRRDGNPRIDCDSPLWSFIDAIRDSTAAYRFGPPAMLATGRFAGHASIMLVVEAPQGRGRKQYLFDQGPNGGWLLTRHERLLMEQGPATSGRLVSVLERRPAAPWTLPAFLLENLDAAAAEMIELLALPAARAGEIEADKLHYMLADPSTVEYVAGDTSTDGALMASGIVLTPHPYDTHDLAKLVIQAWIQDLPLGTLPALKFGLAAHLGGLRGWHPAALDRWGRAAVAAGAVTIDELLAWNGHDSAPRDVTAAAAAFAGLLREGYGPDALRAAYEFCSGSSQDVANRPVEEIKRRLQKGLKTDWTTLADRFDAWCRAGRQPALPPAELNTDELSGLAATARQTLGTLDVRIVAHGGRIFVLAAAAAAPVHAALVFGGGESETQPNALYAEHFPAVVYRGETHALVLTPHGTRLYDYRRQIVIAHHCEDIWPGERTGLRYLRNDGTALAVEVPADLLPSLIDWRLLVPAP